MSHFILLAVFAFSATQSFAWDQDQVQECRSKFAPFVAESLSLKFVCTDPSTEMTRSTFIALQYAGTELAYSGEEIETQTVVICASSAGVAWINQWNDLVSGVGLLRLLGKDGIKNEEVYL
ncbi:MAG: hypothetical protein GW917_01090, partial [Bdellovibrionales bacterium]|nr:hypothetical protein [Bdellovibrionales bacterium]